MKTTSLPKASQTRGIPRGMGWLLFLSIAPAITGAPSLSAGPPLPLGGLREAAEIARDDKGIAHLHAQDRLFQMDMNRHLGRGALAELLGQAALPTDVQLRAIGLHRAAERTLPVLSSHVRAVLQAYTDGVSPYYGSALLSWLVNETFPVLLRSREQTHNVTSLTRFVPLE